MTGDLLLDRRDGVRPHGKGLPDMKDHGVGEAQPEQPEYGGDRRRFLIWALYIGAIRPERVELRAHGFGATASDERGAWR
jgi:hypothetical protein